MKIGVQILTSLLFICLDMDLGRELLGELNEAMEQIQNSYPSMLNEILLTYYPVYEEQFYPCPSLSSVHSLSHV